MKNKQNLHTHTTFCDGRNTPSELISTAIERGFDSLGFSMHCDPSVGDTKSTFPEKFQAYKDEILRLKAQWHGKFPIFLGIEYDVYADHADALPQCEYRIGSVHYLKTESGYVKMDQREAQAVKDCIDQNFGGEFLRFAASYYGSLAELPKYGSFDIIGHFDLLTKHAKSFPEWELSSPKYLKLAAEAADALKGKVPFFEVNTGAIARGYKSTPYPAENILNIMKENGFGAVISTDCHNKDFLDNRMEEARELLIKAGFRSRYILTDQGFTETEI